MNRRYQGNITDRTANLVDIISRDYISLANYMSELLFFVKAYPYSDTLPPFLTPEHLEMTINNLYMAGYDMSLLKDNLYEQSEELKKNVDESSDENVVMREWAIRSDQLQDV